MFYCILHNVEADLDAERHILCGATMTEKTDTRIPTDEHELASAIVEKIRQAFDDPLVQAKSGVDRSSHPLITVTVNTRRIAEYTIRS